MFAALAERLFSVRRAKPARWIVAALLPCDSEDVPMWKPADRLSYRCSTFVSQFEYAVSDWSGLPNEIAGIGFGVLLRTVGPFASLASWCSAADRQSIAGASAVVAWLRASPAVAAWLEPAGPFASSASCRQHHRFPGHRPSDLRPSDLRGLLLRRPFDHRLHPFRHLPGTSGPERPAGWRTPVLRRWQLSGIVARRTGTYGFCVFSAS